MQNWDCELKVLVDIVNMVHGEVNRGACGSESGGWRGRGTDGKWMVADDSEITVQGKLRHRWRVTSRGLRNFCSVDRKARGGGRSSSRSD